MLRKKVALPPQGSAKSFCPIWRKGLQQTNRKVERPVNSCFIEPHKEEKRIWTKDEIETEF